MADAWAMTTSLPAAAATQAGPCQTPWLASPPPLPRGALAVAARRARRTMVARALSCSLTLITLAAASVSAPRHVWADEPDTEVLTDPLAPRLELPRGPGSRLGWGGLEPLGATALPRFVRELRLPPAAGGLEPPLALVFAPGTGQGVFGLDLDLPLPALELGREDGLPRAGTGTLDDLRLVGLGRGSRWVEVAEAGLGGAGTSYRESIEADSPLRIRAEDGEVRVAEVDGRTWIFADEPGARVTDALGVLHYARPTALVDAFGNHVEFEWHRAAPNTRPRLAAVRWNEGTAELNVVTAPRPDRVRGFAGGVAVETVERVVGLEIRVDGTRTSFVEIDYATDDAWIGSRVEAIRETAEDGTPAPTWRVHWGDPEATSEARVWAIDDGLPVDGAGVRWLDVDGDALPDLLDGRLAGAWRWRRNGGGEGLDPWQELVVSPSFALDAGTFAADVDGDGRAELLRDVAGSLGEIRVWWGGTATPWATSDSFDLGLPLRLDDPELALVDLDDDGRSDVFAVLGDDAVWLRALARPAMIDPDGGSTAPLVFAAAETMEAPPAELRPGAPGVVFAEIDGDGLADLVRVDTTAGRIRFAPSLGFGRFGEETLLADDLALTGFASVRIADANGDGLDDVLRIAGDEVNVSLGRGDGLSSTNPRGIDALSNDAALFTFDADGDGGIDLVVHDRDAGQVRVTPLLGGLAALPRSVENGAGLRTSLEFEAAARVAHGHAKDGRPWVRHVPLPLAVLTTLTETEVDRSSRSVISVRDPIRAGAARRFVGFAEVAERVEDPEGVPLVERLRVHADDSTHEALAGLVVTTKVGDGERWLHEVQYTHAVTNPAGGVVSARLTRADELAFEGISAAQAQRRATLHVWDGWGNAVRTEQLGRVDLNSGADLPGDERIDVHTYTTPREPWLPHGAAAPRDRASEHRVEDRDGTVLSRTQWRYDGSSGGDGSGADAGLPLGESTRGAPVRARVWVAGDTWIDARARRFDARGRVTWQRDGAGTTHELVWDELGRHVVEERRWLDAEGSRALVTRASWSPVHGGLQTFVDPRGATWRFTYDGFGHTTARFEPGDAPDAPSASWETRFDALGGIWRRELAKLDDAGNRAEIVEHLDSAGRLRARVVQSGSRDAAATSDEPAIAEVIKVYDALGRVVIEATGAVARDELLAAFTLDTSVVDELVRGAELRTVLVHDALDRVIATDDGAGAVALTEFSPGLTRTRTVRGALEDRPSDVSPSAWVRSIASAAVDVDRVTTRHHDGLDRVVAVEVDAADMAPTTLVWTWTWDAASRLVSIVDPAGSVTLVEHDGAGRRIAIDGQDTGRTAFAYDGAGRWVARVDATGTRLHRTLDALGRPLREWAVDSEGAPRGEISWTWDVAREPDVADAPGLLLGVDDAAGRVDFAYDARGRELRRTRRGLGCAAFVDGDFATPNLVGEHTFTVGFGRRYDARGLVVADVFADASYVTREYDSRGLLRAVPGFIDAIEWDAAARWRAVTLGNGAIVTRSLDRRGQVTSTEVTAHDGTALALNYTYDDAGRLSAIDDATPLVSGFDAARFDARFDYDGLGRLVADEGAWGRSTTAFDDVGRVASRAVNDESWKMTWDPSRPHVVTAMGAQVLDWDDAGRLSAIHADDQADHVVGDEPAGTNEPLPTSTWVHDAWGHPTKVTLADGTVVRWIWDFAGERVGVCQFDANGRILHDEWRIGAEQTLENGELVRWVHALGQRWVESRRPWTPGDGIALPLEASLPAQHLGWAGLVSLLLGFLRRRGRQRGRHGRQRGRRSGRGATKVVPHTWPLVRPCKTASSAITAVLLVAALGGCAEEPEVRLVPLQPDADTRFHVHDRLGSSALLMDANGDVVSRVQFDPRGVIVGGEADAPVHFAGARRLSAMPAYDFGPRVLLAPLGRFTSPDPKLARDQLERGVDVPLQLDPHGYAEDDPMNLVDPEGLEARTVTVGVSLTFGVIAFSASVSLVTDDKGGVAVATSTGTGPGLGASAGATLSAGKIHGNADIHSVAGSSVTGGASGGPSLVGPVIAGDVGMVDGHLAHSVGLGAGAGSPEGHVYVDAPTTVHTLREPDRSPVPAAMQAAVRTAAVAGDTSAVARATTTLAKHVVGS